MPDWGAHISKATCYSTVAGSKQNKLGLPALRVAKGEETNLKPKSHQFEPIINLGAVTLFHTGEIVAVTNRNFTLAMVQRVFRNCQKQPLYDAK